MLMGQFELQNSQSPSYLLKRQIKIIGKGEVWASFMLKGLLKILENVMLFTVKGTVQNIGKCDQVLIIVKGTVQHI